MKTFEDFLIDKHAENYIGSKDSMIDDFNDWLCDLETDDFLKYGDMFAKELPKIDNKECVDILKHHYEMRKMQCGFYKTSKEAKALQYVISHLQEPNTQEPPTYTFKQTFTADDFLDAGKCDCSFVPPTQLPQEPMSSKEPEQVEEISPYEREELCPTPKENGVRLLISKFNELVISYNRLVKRLGKE